MGLDKIAIHGSFYRVGLFVIGLISLLYWMYGASFAEINIQFSFLDFPIFIGEVTLTICTTFLLSGFLIIRPELKWWHLLFMLYMGFVLVKAGQSFFFYGPLALRHAAMLYYPLFAVCGYFFYRKTFFTLRIRIATLCLIPVLYFFGFFNAFSLSSISILLVVFLLSSPKHWLRYVFVIMTVLVVPYGNLFQTKIRAVMMGNLTMFFYFAFCMLMTRKFAIRYQYRVLIAATFLVGFGIWGLFQTDAAKSRLNPKEVVRSCWEYNETFKKERLGHKKITIANIKIFNPQADDMERMERLSIPLKNKLKNIDAYFEKKRLEKIRLAQELTHQLELEKKVKEAELAREEAEVDLAMLEEAVSLSPVELEKKVKEAELAREEAEVDLAMLEEAVSLSPVELEKKVKEAELAREKAEVDLAMLEEAVSLSPVELEKKVKEAKVAREEAEVDLAMLEEAVSLSPVELEKKVKEAELAREKAEVDLAMLEEAVSLSPVELEKKVKEAKVAREEAEVDLAMLEEAVSLSPVELEKKVKEAKVERPKGSTGNVVFRLFIWLDVIEDLLNEKAVLGVPLGKPFRSKRIEILGWARSEWLRDGWISVHNSFLDVIYRAGIVGVLGILAIGFAFFRMTRKAIRFRSVRGMLLCGVLGFWMTAACSSEIFELPYYAIPFWCLFGAAASFTDQLQNA